MPKSPDEIFEEMGSDLTQHNTVAGLLGEPHEMINEYLETLKRNKKIPFNFTPPVFLRRYGQPTIVSVLSLAREEKEAPNALLEISRERAVVHTPDYLPINITRTEGWADKFVEALSGLAADEFRKRYGDEKFVLVQARENPQPHTPADRRVPGEHPSLVPAK